LFHGSEFYVGLYFLCTDPTLSDKFSKSAVDLQIFKILGKLPSSESADWVNTEQQHQGITTLVELGTRYTRTWQITARCVKYDVYVQVHGAYRCQETSSVGVSDGERFAAPWALDRNDRITTISVLSDVDRANGCWCTLQWLPRTVGLLESVGGLPLRRPTIHRENAMTSLNSTPSMVVAYHWQPCCVWQEELFRI